jgi:hypothetical protein
MNIVDKLVGGGGGGGSWSVYCNNFVAEYECCGEGVMVSNSKLGNGVVGGWCWVDIEKYWGRQMLGTGMGWLVDSILGADNKIG